MKNGRRSIDHHQSQANERITRARKRKLMQPANFPVEEANRTPKRNLPKKSQIMIKSIGPIEVWDLHDGGVDFDEIWVDLTAVIASKEWETRLVFDNPIQAEEFITKLGGALAQREIEKSVRRLIRRTK